MIKRPQNTKTLYSVHLDIANNMSDELYKGELASEAIKVAKRLGEDKIWHILETRVYACSNRTFKERNERLGYDNTEEKESIA